MTEYARGVIEGYLKGYTACKQDLEEHGHWEPNPEHKEWDFCSNCNTGTKRREYGFNPDGTEWVSEECYSFCPHCGAIMDEEVE